MFLTIFHVITGHSVSGQNERIFEAAELRFQAISEKLQLPTCIVIGEVPQVNVVLNAYEDHVPEKLLIIQFDIVMEPELKLVLGSLKVQETETTEPLRIEVHVAVLDERLAVGAIVSFVPVAVIQEATVTCPVPTTLQLKFIFHSASADKSTQLKLIHQLQAFDQLKDTTAPVESEISTLTVSHTSRDQLNTTSKS